MINMATERKFWKSTITVTVLTCGEKPPQYMSLDEVNYDITEGDASGLWAQVDSEMTQKEMDDALIAQGSDPEFFASWE